MNLANPLLLEDATFISSDSDVSSKSMQIFFYTGHFSTMYSRYRGSLHCLVKNICLDQICTQFRYLAAKLLKYKTFCDPAQSYFNIKKKTQSVLYTLVSCCSALSSTTNTRAFDLYPFKMRMHNISVVIIMTISRSMTVTVNFQNSNNSSTTELIGCIGHYSTVAALSTFAQQRF